MRSIVAAGAAALAAAQGYGPITNLPGYSGNAVMSSGYITVNATAGRSLFFWFVEAATNPATAPVVFWTNGGPGCSSLGGGLFSENGPFRPQPDGSLAENPWSWHNAANMLYVEQPAGVGFSYSNTTSDYTVGDQRAWADMYLFIQGWLNAYPQYRSSPFWITGESYGGHYVPGFAAYVVAQNLAGKQPKVNLAGFMVGNAWTDAYWDNTGAVTQWYGHGQISNDSYNGILNTCNMSTVGPLLARAGMTQRAEANEVVSGFKLTHGVRGFKSKAPVTNEKGELALPTYKGQDCNGWQTQAESEQGNVDIYDLYSDVCTQQAKDARKRSVRITDAGDSNGAAGCAAEYDPCIDDYTDAYLNRKDVQQAIHVVSSLIPTGQWTGCTNIVNYSYTDLLSSMIPTYQYLLQAFPAGKYLVFSGDVDGIVPFTGTRFWLNTLGFPVTTPFQPWNTPQGQVGGYTYTLSAPNGAQLHYASVRNAGHLVPTTQGSRGLQLFSTFLTQGSVV